jgi:DNA end-binding protein Ku
MAARPTWQGHLRLSLVTCPVALYTATSRSGDVSFNLINPKTNNRIRMIATDPDTGPIERSDLVKGYEFEKNQYVVLSDDEIQSVRIESNRTLDIERFVDAADIDRLYWNDPFFMVPDGKMAAEAYAVIRTALEQSGKIALGRVVLHSRERLMALEPRDDGIVAYSLRAFNEVRKPQDFFDSIPDVKAETGMVEIAGKIIEQLAGPFEPSSFHDRYEDALRALIDAKLKGKKPTVTAPEPEDTKGKDLMAMLKRSLEHSATPARRAPAKRAEPAKRRAAPTAKRAASRK